MVAAPSDGFHRPHWRSSLLSPTEEEEEEELDVGERGQWAPTNLWSWL